jgi:hypothetical protein
MQMPAVRLPQDSTTPCSQDALVMLREVINDRLLNVAKGALALALEVQTNRAAYSLLDHMVTVGETNSQPSGELAPDGGFS